MHHTVALKHGLIETRPRLNSYIISCLKNLFAVFILLIDDKQNRTTECQVDIEKPDGYWGLDFGEGKLPAQAFR